MKSLVQKLSVAAIFSALILGHAAPANAYPVGTAPQLLVSQTTQLQLGQIIQAQGINVAQGCTATFFLGTSSGTAGANFIDSSKVGTSNSTPVTHVALPARAGFYYLILETTGCSHSVDNVTLTQKLSVGGKYVAKVSMWAFPLVATAHPTFTVHARLQFANAGLQGVTAKIVARDPKGVVVFKRTSTTDVNGSVRVRFQPNTASKGRYSVKVVFAAKDTFGGMSASDTGSAIR